MISSFALQISMRAQGQTENNPPVITGLQTNQSQCGSAGSATFNVEDADGDIFTLTATSSNPTLLPDANITINPIGSSQYELDYFTSVGEMGSGDITIVADDGNGGQTSVSFTISVNGPTAIVTQPVSAGVPFNNHAAFVVGATGVNLLYQWQKEGVNVGDHTAALQFNSVSVSDLGRYTVTVTGDCGTETSSGALLILKEAKSCTDACAGPYIHAITDCELANDITSCGGDPACVQSMLAARNACAAQALVPYVTCVQACSVVAPRTPASNIAFTDVFSHTLTLTFSKGDAVNHLVLVRKGSTGTYDLRDIRDGTSYDGNSNFPLAPPIGKDGFRIVLAGPATSVAITGLGPGVEYEAIIIAYNGSGHSTLYLTKSFPKAKVTTALPPKGTIVLPHDGAINQNLTITLTSNTVMLATLYTIEVSPVEDFSSDVQSKSGSRIQTFNGLAYGTTYYAHVKTDLRPDFGITTSFTTAPPEYFSYVTSPGNNMINVNFIVNVTANLVAGAGEYFIELNTAPDFSGTSLVHSGSARIYSFSGLRGSTTYYNRVHTDLSAEWGPTRSFTTKSASAGLYITIPADNAVNVLWDLDVTTSMPMMGATSYTVELNTAPDFTGTPIVQTGATNKFHFSGLNFNTLYHSRVKTNLGDVWGPSRQFTTGNPAGISYLSTPANSAVNVSAAVTVKANLVPAATEYTVELNTAEDFSGPAIVKSGPSQFIAFAGLSLSQTYYNRVKTNLDPGWGQTQSFMTKSASSFAYVTKPANGATGVLTDVDVTVNTIAGATLYTLELNTAPDFSGTSLVQSGASTKMHFAGLTFATAYYNRVRSNLDSNWGPTRQFTTGSASDYAYIKSPADGALNVGFSTNITSNTVPGASQYTIQVSPMTDFSSGVVERTGGTPTLAFSGLAYDTKYYARVSTDLSGSGPTCQQQCLQAQLTCKSTDGGDPDLEAACDSQYANCVAGCPGGPLIQWGPIKSFTTTNPVAISFITSPMNGTANVNYVVTLTANLVPGATGYTIEANTMPDFSGTSILKTGAARMYPFQLAYDQLYYIRVQTDLVPDVWGEVRSFTTGTPLSLSYITSPMNNGTGVPTTVNVSANTLFGATSYTVELNTTATFDGISIVMTGSSKTKNFSGLSQSSTYYARVMTSLTPGQWGPTRSFSTVNPAARQIVNWEGDSEEGDVEIHPDKIVFSIFPNPFADKINLLVQSDLQLPAECTLFDISGREVLRKGGSTNSLMEMGAGLASGIYILRIATPLEVKTVRLVKP